jgi:hypothetical protein
LASSRPPSPPPPPPTVLRSQNIRDSRTDVSIQQGQNPLHQRQRCPQGAHGTLHARWPARWRLSRTGQRRDGGRRRRSSRGRSRRRIRSSLKAPLLVDRHLLRNRYVRSRRGSARAHWQRRSNRARTAFPRLRQTAPLFNRPLDRGTLCFVHPLPSSFNIANSSSISVFRLNSSWNVLSFPVPLDFPQLVSKHFRAGGW